MKTAAYLLLIPLLILSVIWHENNWHVWVLTSICYIAGVLLEKGIQRAKK